MEIRKIKKSDDINAIGKIYEKSWKFAYDGIIPKDYLDSISGNKWLPHFENKNMNSLVLIENNQFIGTSSYCKSRNELIKLGYKSVFLWVLEENTRAKRFYEKQKFKLSDKSNYINIGGKNLKEVAYMNCMQ